MGAVIVLIAVLLLKFRKTGKRKSTDTQNNAKRKSTERSLPDLPKEGENEQVPIVEIECSSISGMETKGFIGGDFGDKREGDKHKKSKSKSSSKSSDEDLYEEIDSQGFINYFPITIPH